MRTYTNVHINNETESEFRLVDLNNDGTVWVLQLDMLSIFMTSEQVKQLTDTIGKIYWGLPVPELEMRDED